MLLAQYLFFLGMAGAARGAAGIMPPAMTGDESFERASRVHLNTLEQIAIALPAMWICATYFRTDVAVGFGLLMFVGRLIYRAAYLKDPAKRVTGAIIGLIANAGLILSSFWGVIVPMLT